MKKRREYGVGKWAKIYSRIDSPNLSKKHSLMLSGLERPGEYIYYISATNEIGYVIENDNEGQSYKFQLR